MTTVTKKELIDQICSDTGHRRGVVKDSVQRFLELIITELAAGKRLEFRDFGVFEIKVRAPRRAQNPKTLAPVEVPAKKTVKFKVGRSMRACLDGKPLPANDAHGDHEEAEHVDSTTEVKPAASREVAKSAGG